MLERVRGNTMGELEWFRHLPAELLELKEIALSGDGEPTLSPRFYEIVEAVAHFRVKRIY